MTPEHTAQIQSIRSKVLQDPNFHLSPEGRVELAKAVAILRSDRVGASAGSTKTRTAKAEAARPIDTGALLANLKAIGNLGGPK